MVLVNKGQDNKYYMDGYLKTNLTEAKRIVSKDWDMVFMIDGREGGGKSGLAQQVGHYLDPTLDLSRIVFTPDGFEEAINNASKYQCVIYDEAYGGL